MGVLRWKGALANGGATMRRVVTAVLAVACVALAFTQVGFIGVQFADGGSSYLIVMLLPVALAALLLGTFPGAVMGLFAGAALFLHSTLMPLDYYELAYVTPVTSIVMMCVCGLLLGVLLALVLRRRRSRAMRIVLVACACLAVSAVFTAGFTISTTAMMVTSLMAESGLDLDSAQFASVLAGAQMAALVTGDAAFQAIGDAVLMAVVCLLGLLCAERGLRLAEQADLRTIYGAWLSVVVWIAFMVVATAAYGAITAGSLADADAAMRGEVEYLLGQVERTAEYNGKVADALMGEGLSWEQIDEVTSSGGMLDSLIAGYAEDTDGLVVAAVGRYVIVSDAERISGGEELADVFDIDVGDAIAYSEQNSTLERVIYIGPSTATDLVDLRLPGSADSEAFSTLLSQQIGYLSATEHDDYQVIMIRPASLVFAGRSAVMGWVTLSSFVLLLVVFALAWRLLDLMVGRRVDALNAGLAEITAGKLDTRVAPEGSREFVALAGGINRTVDALQGWIAEAETRMDAELATAKAIQESALPRVFPPFPDILRFDVYATMNAAKEVGGDFYDFFLIGDGCTPDAGKLGFVLADVSGKGVPAALFMMKAKTQLRDYMESGMELGEAVENANRQLCDGNDAGMFVTVWAGVLDYATGHIDFVNAGHNPPLLWQSPIAPSQIEPVGATSSSPIPEGTDASHVIPSGAPEGLGAEGSPSPPAQPEKGGWRWLTEKSGLPLGLFDGFPYEAHSVECRIGDHLLLYTDGVTEAMSASGELYGEERLEALLNANYTLHPRELIERVRRSVAEHAVGAEQSDDITMLALEVGVPPEITATLTVPASVDELPRVNEFIHTELDRRLCPVRAQNQLDIAVEELFVNVAHYAYEGVGEDVPHVARVSYTYSAEPPSVQVDIADDGVPYDPLAKPDAVTPDDIMEVPIGGLGILMAKNSVDEMRYARIDGSNVVSIVKKW